MKLILHVVGARPNFMKAAPVISALNSYPFKQTLLHTGQHYDENMSRVFFKELGLPAPDINLDVRSGSQTAQTAGVMQRFEPILKDLRPDLVVVYGDVNSTLAATLVCAKEGVAVAHVESGLRSGDRTMPEEINRLVTDRLADLLFTPSSDGDENLLREGTPRAKVHLVGNVMIDTLVRLLPLAENRPLTKQLTAQFQKYALVTLHRPSNVDYPANLRILLETLRDMSSWMPVIFPVHPRTRERAREIGFDSSAETFQWTEPLSYLDFLALQKNAAIVVTDSGGIQEETTFLNIPCLTLRENTERPVTVSVGTNRLIGKDPSRLVAEVRRTLSTPPQGNIPPLWDGKAAERIARITAEYLQVPTLAHAGN